MARKRSPEGRFTVSGPTVDEHPAPSLGAGLSAGYTFANRHRYEDGEFTYYVRDVVSGKLHAFVTKHAEGGVISATEVL